jgi:preprotein translocase subunit YajC
MRIDADEIKSIDNYLFVYLFIILLFLIHYYFFFFKKNNNKANEKRIELINF